jgi:signal recognition particle receptor subunit beta
MVFFNYSTMQMAAKVVYYGPGLCGKTTNLHHIYTRTAAGSRGEMVSLETETDRTLFFDLLPIDVGQISGFSTRIQLYTVPGQVFYNTTRKLVLKGVDGVVFVADSQRAMAEANVESFRNLEENLAEMGLAIDSMPLVLQYNKRDLPEILSVDELQRLLNRQGWPAYEASAIQGKGVFETLKGISKMTLLALRKRLAAGAEPAATAAPVRPGAAPMRPLPAAVPPPRPAAPPAPAAVAAPAPPPAEAKAPPARKVARRAVDVDDELDRLRRETRIPRPAAPAPPASPRETARTNGSGEITRSIELILKPADYQRARRVTLSFQVEDAERRVVDARDLEVDLDDPAALERVLLRFKIALQAESQEG